MIVLLLAAAIPVAAIALANALQDHRAALAEGRRGVESLRDVLGARYGAALDDAEALLLALAALDPWRQEGAVGCSVFLRDLLRLHRRDFAELRVVDSEGAVLCEGQPGASAVTGVLLAEAETAGRPVLGRFSLGEEPGPTLPVVVPVAEAGLTVRFVAASVLLRDPRPEAEGAASFAWLLDREGRALAAGGAPPTPPDGVATSLPPGGEAVSSNGVAYAAADLRPGLRLVVGRPTAPFEAAARALLVQRATELAAFLLVCLAAIVIGADLAMVRPLRLLAGRVRGWRPGREFRPGPSGTEPREVREVEQALAEAATALTRREADLRAALDQSDALMAEIHHRVKNNLQIVSSLLNLQAGRIGDPAASEAFRAARNRVRALATLHRHLYLQQSFETVSLRPFLQELATQQFAARGEVPGERISLRLEVADLALPTDQAVPLALLVTEALGNALDHAFPDDARGSISLSIATDAGAIRLEIADDGRGLPPRESRPRGLGLQLVEGFARQLGGLLAEEEGPGGGTLWRVTFSPRANQAARSLGG